MNLKHQFRFVYYLLHLAFIYFAVYCLKIYSAIYFNFFREKNIMSSLNNSEKKSCIKCNTLGITQKINTEINK